MAQEQLLHRNVQRFRGGLVFKAHRHLYHSTLGLRVIKKRKEKEGHIRDGITWVGRGILEKCCSIQSETDEVMLRDGKGNSNSHGARPVHLIITMIQWIRTSRLSIKNSLSAR